MDHTSKLQEAFKTAEATETVKVELESKGKKLEEDLATAGRESLELKADMEKTAHTMAELQTSLSSKNQELTGAKGTIADLKLKLIAPEQNLEEGKAREKKLLVNWNKDKALLSNAKKTFNDL